jgi:hypothetical protein
VGLLGAGFGALAFVVAFRVLPRPRAISSGP